MICEQELKDFFSSVRQKSRQKELEKKYKVDPKKLQFFIQMKKDTKKQVSELKSNYERSPTKSLQKKR